MLGYEGGVGAFLTGAATYGFDVEGLNGQFHTRNAISAEDNAGTPTVYGINIAGGVYVNTIETPFYLVNAKAVTISDPIVGNYNGKLSTTNNPALSDVGGLTQTYPGVGASLGVTFTNGWTAFGPSR